MFLPESEKSKLIWTSFIVKDYALVFDRKLDTNFLWENNVRMSLVCVTVFRTIIA